jgi:mannose-1-phosphate guanylyltransferase
MTEDVKVLIMCGGQGTRMWPISNMAHPKQFESILGKKSMFRETVDRVLEGFPAEDIYIATSSNFEEHIKSQAHEIPHANFILEPAMRDNLGALGLATKFIAKRHPNAVMIILWGADHVVQDIPRFLNALKIAAVQAAENNLIVHVDTKPTYPSVHNGWIEIGDKIKEVDDQDVFEFVHHVEKPSLEKAKLFYVSDQYLIHTGYMATRAKLLLSYYEQYAPAAYELIEKIGATIDTPAYEKVLQTEYPKFEKISVDYGLFEKLPPRTQWEVPAEFGWIDVGTWELLYHGLPKDAHGNVIIGKATLLDVTNCLIISKHGGTVGLIGLRDMVVVQSDNDLLVSPLSKAPLVKDLYNQLQQQ